MACKHIFLVASPNGQITKGVCKKCGHERDMYNYVDYKNPYGVLKGARNDKE